MLAQRARPVTVVRSSEGSSESGSLSTRLLPACEASPFQQRVSLGSEHLRGSGAQCVVDEASQSHGQGLPGAGPARGRAGQGQGRPGPALSSAPGPSSPQEVLRACLREGSSTLPCWGAGSKQSPLPRPCAGAHTGWSLHPALCKATRRRGGPWHEALHRPPPHLPPSDRQAPTSALLCSSLSSASSISVQG